MTDAYPDQSGSPRITLSVDVDATVLRTYCVDVSSVIAATKTAVAAMLSAHPAAPLGIDEVAMAAASVDGVINVRSVRINGDSADLATFAGSAPVLANIVVIGVRTVS